MYKTLLGHKDGQFLQRCGDDERNNRRDSDDTPSRLVNFSDLESFSDIPSLRNKHFILAAI